MEQRFTRPVCTRYSDPSVLFSNFLIFARIAFRYYDCTIQEVTANGYKVVFPAYGNVEEVPLEYLQKKVTVSLAKVRCLAAASDTFVFVWPVGAIKRHH